MGSSLNKSIWIGVIAALGTMAFADRASAGVVIREAAAAMTPAVPPSEATPAAWRNNAPPEVVLTFPHDAMGATAQSNGATTFASAILTDDDQEMHNLVAWLHGEYVLSRPDPPPVNLMRPPETVVTLRV